MGEGREAGAVSAIPKREPMCAFTAGLMFSPVFRPAPTHRGGWRAMSEGVIDLTNERGGRMTRRQRTNANPCWTVGLR